MILFSMDLGDTLGVRFGFPLHQVPWIFIHITIPILSVTCFDLSFLGMSCSSLSHIATFVSQLVSPFSSTSIHRLSYPFSFSSILIDHHLTS